MTGTLNSDGSTFYDRQLVRLQQNAIACGTKEARMLVGTARIAARTAPRPDGNTRFAMMTWMALDGETLPRWVSYPDGNRYPRQLRDLTQFHEVRGRVSVERALSAMPIKPAIVAIPVEMIDQITSSASIANKCITLRPSSGTEGLGISRA